MSLADAMLARRLPRQAERSLNSGFLYAVSALPLIGNRDAAEPLDSHAARRIAEGLREEHRRLQREAAELRRLGENEAADELRPYLVVTTNKRGKVDLALELEACPPEELPDKLAWLYTVHSYIYKQLNRAMRLRDETRNGLKAFGRGLFDAIGSDSFEKVQGRVYRVMDMSRQIVEENYKKSGDEPSNTFSWDGFVSVAVEAHLARRNLHVFEANTLVIIDTKCNGPADVRRASDFGEAEGEAIFPPGQQFQKVAVEFDQPWGQVWADLGVPDVAGDCGSGTVIRLEAVDRFHEMVQSIGRDDEATWKCIEPLKVKVDQARAGSGDLVETLFSLSIGQERIRDYTSCNQSKMEMMRLCEQDPEVRAHLQQVKTMARKVKAPFTSRTVFPKLHHFKMALRGVVKFCTTQGDLQTALDLSHYRLALENPFSGAAVSALETIGRLHEDMGALDEAMAWQRQALGKSEALPKKKGEKGWVETARILHHIGWLKLYDADRRERRDDEAPRAAHKLRSEALAAHQQALQVRLECLGDKHKDVAKSHDNLARAHRHLAERGGLDHEERLREALNYYIESACVYAVTVGFSHYHTLKALIHADDAIDELGDDVGRPLPGPPPPLAKLAGHWHQRGCPQRQVELQWDDDKSVLQLRLRLTDGQYRQLRVFGTDGFKVTWPTGPHWYKWARDPSDSHFELISDVRMEEISDQGQFVWLRSLRNIEWQFDGESEEHRSLPTPLVSLDIDPADESASGRSSEDYIDDLRIRGQHASAAGDGRASRGDGRKGSGGWTGGKGGDDWSSSKNRGDGRKGSGGWTGGKGGDDWSSSKNGGKGGRSDRLVGGEQDAGRGGDCGATLAGGGGGKGYGRYRSAPGSPAGMVSGEDARHIRSHASD